MMGALLVTMDLGGDGTHWGQMRLFRGQKMVSNLARVTHIAKLEINWKLRLPAKH